MKYQFERIEDETGLFSLEGNLIGEQDGMSFTEDFNEEIEDGCKFFIIDLSELKHVNSSGLGVLITCLTKARKKDGEVILVNPSDYIRNLMMITKLNSIFSIYDTVEAAKVALEGN